MGDVVSVKDTSTVEHAIKLMSEHKILSLPVMDEGGQCVGIVDTLDVVSFVLSVAPDRLSLDENELRSLEIAGRAMAFKELKDVIGMSGRDPYVPIYVKNPASQALVMFAAGIHRAPVLDESGAVAGTISQSSLVRELAANLHMGALKVVGEKMIAELGLGLAAPITIAKGATVLQALNTIQENNVSGLAVVDDESGRLVGNFSGSDIKALYREQWPSFLLSVEEFLNKHSPASMSPICVQQDTTFLDACKEISNSHVHRLWVVDGDYKPVGVVSTTDVMKACRDVSE
eukprot:TRINITY_DN1601_c0_g1_i1.p1 TRINITY_DN1601_c0_g1~~TRINITY_DN1601_c0_g1_i1.p1  ORF type:complete len:321 (+),score=136.89 TRINITY_DN1601_c0_g1_i1:102-965(+)